MGRKATMLTRFKHITCLALLMVALTLSSVPLRAQTNNYVPPPGAPGYNNVKTTLTDDDVFYTMVNAYLQVSLGVGKNQGGSIGLFTTSGNATDPFDALLFYEKLIPPKTVIPYSGSRVFVRIDGGKSTAGKGYDYELGQPDPAKGGAWLQIPGAVGSHIEAKWLTVGPTTTGGTTGGTTTGGTTTGGNGGGGNGGGGTGGGSTGPTTNPQIEIDITISFVHDVARFEFDIINHSSQSHTVGLAFVEDILQAAALRLPNQPYIHHEVLLSSAQVPNYFELFNKLSPTVYQSLRGFLRPTNTSGVEPTPPTRFVVGDNLILNGTTVISGGFGGSGVPRLYPQIWNYIPDPNALFEGNRAFRECVALFWDEQPIAPSNASNPTKIVTYVGQGNCDHDFGQPLTLSVTGPQALGLAPDPTTGKSTITGSPFTVGAYVTNVTDLFPDGGFTISPIGLSINLPKGLQLVAGDTASKSVSNLSPGGEGSATWQVVPDGTANGLLTYTVTATPSLGNGKIVQRTIEIPVPALIKLRGNPNLQGRYEMKSFPLAFNGETPSKVLFPTLDPNLAAPDLARWDPIKQQYGYNSPSFQLGNAYWIRNRLATDQSISLDLTKYPPVFNQTQANGSYQVSFPKGWNQVGNPYIYGIRFSEIRVFDGDTLQSLTMEQAADPTKNLILPAVYHYDTTDPDETKWHYELIDNLGFTMQPYEGYWLYVRKSNLQFIFPPVDTPFSSVVTRAALMGVGFSAKTGRGVANNWRLQLAATGATGVDSNSFIGVAPQALDTADQYKYMKPPVINKGVTLDIMHEDWTDGTRFAQDLRASNKTRKVWDIAVSSGAPNEDVTLSWANITRSVPRSTKLTLIDTANKTSLDLRNRPSYIVNTGTTSSRRIQIVAEPSLRTGRVQITNFDVVLPTRGAHGSQSVTINYGLSDQADARIVISDARGRVLRTIDAKSGTRAAAGTGTTGTAIWDLKNNQGATISAGSYHIELTVLGSDGQLSRQLRPVVISR